MNKHEERLRDMHRDGANDIGDYMGIDDESAAACLAGAEALALLAQLPDPLVAASTIDAHLVAPDWTARVRALLAFPLPEEPSR